MTNLPAKYQPERVHPELLGEWLRWSLGFFTEPVPQNPYLDVTLQWDVTHAYAAYQRHKAHDHGRGTFFAFLVWHLTQTLAGHPAFNLRWVNHAWYRLHNPPLFIPVAVGGPARFSELVLEDVYQQDYPTFLSNYLEQLQAARQPNCRPQITSAEIPYAHVMGNLPYLRFTGLTLHWRPDQMIGQSYFYVGQRYWQADQLLIPLAVKLHHACTDPLVLNAVLADFRERFPDTSTQEAERPHDPASDDTATRQRGHL